MRFIVVCFCLLFSGCTLIGEQNGRTVGDGQWETANKLFTQDSYWMGSDDAYSIKLDGDRVLWLFGDTLIAKNKGNRDRNAEDTYFIHNTIGIENGLNPSKADIRYHWNLTAEQAPDCYFKSTLIADKNWLWPGDGIVIDNKNLIIFFMDIKPVDYGWGFDIDGWQAVLIRNYKEDPKDWKLEWLNTSDYNKFKIMLGSGGVLEENGYLYAYGDKSADFDHKIYLARWPSEIFDNIKPDLSNPEWWCGEKGWVKESEISVGKTSPKMLWENGQTEFTVNKFPGKDFYIMTQTKWHDNKVGNADMVCRISDSLTGPWSEQYTLYENLYKVALVPDDLNVYAGKLHTELTDGNSDDLIFTYATNTSSGETLWDWDDVYYPRFVKISKSEIMEIIADSKASL